MKSVFPDISMCAFLCMQHRTNDFQKAENVCVTFKKWQGIVIETHSEHCK